MLMSTKKINMASLAKGKLPNLKICVDNTKDIDSNDENSDQEDTNSGDMKITCDSTSPRRSSSSRSDGDFNQSDSESEPENSETESVEFNVRISGLNKDDKNLKSLEESKRYENKSGNFVTGLDLTSKEAQEKKDERAKRFGLPASENKGFIDRKSLLASLGLKEEDVDKGERGIRLEAIHMRGTDEMSTQDIFKYFSEFGPGTVEWIDDSSCNVVWFDPMTVARAILALSKDYDTVIAEEEKTLGKKPTTIGRSESAKDDEEMKEEVDKKEKKTEEKDEEMEIDDELDLNQDDSNFSIPSKITEECSEAENSKETESKETSKEDEDKTETLHDKDSKEDSDSGSKRKRRITWPPGKWRLGLPHPKAKFIFLRYATKADKKVMGAENKSKYYVKYGNPNYGGQRGLISGSRKRRFRAEQRNKEYQSLQEVIEDKRRKESEECDEMTDEEEEAQKPLELFTEKNKVRERIGDRNKDMDGLDMEAELQELLGRPVKKRSMRMYADDIEESQKKSKPKVTTGGLTIIADARDGIESRLGRDLSDVRDVLDARTKLTGARGKLSSSTSGRSPFVSQSPYSSNDLRSKLKKRKSNPTDNLPAMKIQIFD